MTAQVPEEAERREQRTPRNRKEENGERTTPKIKKGEEVKERGGY